MADMKAFRVVLAIPYEVILFGESKDDVLEAIKEGGSELFDDIIENSIPLLDAMDDIYDPATTIVEKATHEDQERILGEADPDIEAALSGENPDGEEDEEEDPDEDGGSDESDGDPEPGEGGDGK